MKTKSVLFSLLILFSIYPSLAQEIWPTQKNDLKIYPIMHASMVWEWNGLSIFIDPVGDAADYKQFSKPNLVLITHSHGDHYSPVTLEGIGSFNVPIIVPQEVADKMDEKLKSKLIVLANGDEKNLMDLQIKAIPAYNYPVTEKSFHIKGVGNGYVITLGGKRAYISGDTGNIPEMSVLKNIDLAFLCMNLPYTMDVDDAAKAIITIEPKVVYPYHFRSQGGFSDLEKFKSLVAAKNTEIDIRILDWYPKK